MWIIYIYTYIYIYINSPQVIIGNVIRMSFQLIIPFYSTRFMMTSSNGNIFRVTGPLYGEFTGHWWIPRTKGQWRGALMFSLIWGLNKRVSKQSRRCWFETPSCSLWCHCDVIKSSTLYFPFIDRSSTGLWRHLLWTIRPFCGWCIEVAGSGCIGWLWCLHSLQTPTERGVCCQADKEMVFNNCSGEIWMKILISMIDDWIYLIWLSLDITDDKS